ncbi:MAG: c-type cytochrome [Gemmatales bacterium]|nr:c-type cytochrome [Gemmatales bacterium]MDW7993574.1 c-type cytochrome [Gemmatales bacterium]
MLGRIGRVPAMLGAIGFAVFVVVVAFHSMRAQSSDGPNAKPGQKVWLPKQEGPFSPEEARQLFQLADPRLHLELVACEPTIQSPIAMSFDEHGRIWLVEMPDYPNGPPPGQAPEGRIKILTDCDGDGFYETAKVFAEQLLFANGLQLWKNGAFVTKAPELLFLGDTSGVGKAEKSEVLYRGFTAENPQLRVSFPTLGWDGWIYCANGLRGGQVVRVNAQGRPEGPVISLAQGDFRFDPRRPQIYEAVTGPGQYGLALNDWGERFVCDNRHHLRFVVFEQRYLRNNPYLAAPSLLYDISVLDRENNPSGAGGRVYPISRNFTTSSLHAGHFSAACGIFVYHGDALPPEYQGAVFTCEPPGNLVHVEILTPKGSIFEARPMFEKKEFLASPDDWFRPVFLTSGPDGALYIVDMYRAVIEHPEYMPPELRSRPDLLWGKERGRIWRIVTKEGRPSRRPCDGLAVGNPRDWPELLEHANGWHRQTAFRLLLQTEDFAAHQQAVFSQLRQLARSAQRPQARALALWLLEHHSQLDKDTLLAALADQHPGVRQQAVRICEHWLKDEQIRAALLQLTREVLAKSQAQDRSPTQEKPPAEACSGLSARDQLGRLLLQLVLTLGLLPEDDRLPVLKEVALAWADDSWMRLAVLASSGVATDRLLAALLLAEDKPATLQGRLDLFRETATVVGAMKDAARITAALRPLTKQAVPESLVHALLLGLAEGMSRAGGRLADWWTTVAQGEPALAQVLEHCLVQATQHAADSSQPVARRVRALEVLAQLPSPERLALMRQLAREDGEVLVRLAAVRALSAQGGKDATEALLELWPSATPAVRRELLEALLRTQERVLALLQTVEQGRIQPGELDAARLRQLLQHANPTIRERVRKVLADSTPQDRQKVYQTYRAALAKTGDVARGRTVFEKHCASCHRVANIGVNVGPDISDTRTKSPEQLLSDILLPNAAIDANYVQYIVVTRSGKTITGIIAAEAPNSITLKRAENQTETVLRSDIEAIQSTGVSLMPDGLEKEITIEQMADLLAFLKNWRNTLVEARNHPAIRVEERDDHLVIETDALQARINKKGYVSGIAAGSFLDKRTGARDLGFGLHIMDFLLAPGWRNDGYLRDAKIHGHLPKHYVEGPQICTQAKQLEPEIIRGPDFLAVRLRFTFTQPGEGYQAGSRWTQTLLFRPGLRYFYSAEEIVSANTLPNVFYRIDMPGHIRLPKQGRPEWTHIYLSYHGVIPAEAFAEDFGPDEKFLYQRKEGQVPARMIRAYQVRLGEKPGPWLAGMTLDPAAVSEAWCHRRGYVCMIQELHGRPVRRGDTFGAAYIVGWFDSLEEMHRIYDQHKGKTRLFVSPEKWELR